MLHILTAEEAYGLRVRSLGRASSWPCALGKVAHAVTQHGPFSGISICPQNVEVLLGLLQGNNNARGVKTVVGLRAGERCQQAEAAYQTPGLECSL